MLIQKSDTKGYGYSFVFKFDRELTSYCQFINKKHGNKNLTFKEGRWLLYSLDIAIELKNRFPEINIGKDIETEYELTSLLREETLAIKAQSEEIKKAKETDLVVKGIRADLYPYQKVGINFFLINNGRAINSDPCGSGKSIQTLGYITHAGLQKTLVICPACVKYNWINECLKFTDLRAKVIDKKSSVKNLVEDFNNYQVYIINYDILKKFFVFIETMNWDQLVIDEFHMIKNPSAIRTKYSSRISRKIPRVIMLSATPFLSRPVELFPGLNILEPSVWKDFYAYSRRYCDGHQGAWGWDSKGSSNLEELQERIAPYFIRRSKKEILPDLPEIRYVNYEVSLDNTSAKQYELAEKEFKKFLLNIKKKTIVEADRALQAEKLVKLGALRQLSSCGKVEAAKELLDIIIDGGEKVVLFSSYNFPLEQLSQDYFKENSVLVTGKTNEKEKNRLVNEFQNNPNIKIFFGGIKSTGVGVNLTAATNAIFLDYSWIPADHVQASQRIHRIGSTSKHIMVYQMFTKGTVDGYMHKLLEKKQILFDKIIDGKVIQEETSTSCINEIIKEFERNIKKEEVLKTT